MRVSQYDTGGLLLSYSHSDSAAHSQKVIFMFIIKGVWRNGSASDSRSEGWEFESLCPHIQTQTLSVTHIESHSHAHGEGVWSAHEA